MSFGMVIRLLRKNRTGRIHKAVSEQRTGFGRGKGFPYQTKADLEGKIVGAQVESAGLDALKADPELSGTVAEIPEYDDYMMALLDLGSSRLDAIAIDKILIGYAISQDPGKYRILDESLSNEYYGIWLCKGCGCTQRSDR